MNELRYTGTFTTFANSSPNGKVAAGSPIAGDLVFEVPTPMKQFTLAFEANILSEGQTMWDIKM